MKYNPYQGVGAGAWDIPRWEELRFPAQSLNPAGSTAPPSVDTATGLLVFSGTADNIIAGVAQMPHGWPPGTAVKPHLHLRFPTSAMGKNTRWRFEYDIADIGADFDFTMGLGYHLHNVMTVANPAAPDKHVLAAWPDLAMTGFEVSACMMWRIARLAASDGADDDTNDCALLEFDIHHQVVRAGTVETP